MYGPVFIRDTVINRIKDVRKDKKAERFTGDIEIKFPQLRELRNAMYGS